MTIQTFPQRRLPLTVDDVERLASVFEKHPQIQAVYLFGSAASGKTHHESDIDLGIVPAPGATLSKLDILADLAKAGFEHADLVVLDTDDILLKREVVRLNRLVYQTSDFDRGDYYSRIMRQYFDFLPYLETQRKAYKRRALHGEA